MKHKYLWLTMRIMRKQKLRTGTIFCGIAFCIFLLETFGRLGYYFWIQVHGGASGADGTDSTQLVLAMLAVVLILLVLVCSIIWLNNLFSLTLAQKWSSFRRLMTLGATKKNIFFMGMAETVIIYFPAVILGEISAVLVEKSIHIKSRFPVWMTIMAAVWVFVFSCICESKPVLHTFQKPLVGGRYHNRRKDLRITIAFTAVFVLYIPVSYLIHTNLRVQREALDQKYGIHYYDMPEDPQALEASIKKCRMLAAENTNGDSVIYVQMAGRVSIKRELLSGELLAVLKQAGWQKEEVWETNSRIIFLDGTQDAVLVSRYRNRVRYKEGNDLFLEVDLLHKNADVSKVRIASGMNEKGEMTGPYFYPEKLSDEVPEGVGDSGEVTVILPLESLKTVCGAGNHIQGLSVCGCFEEQGETLFGKLQKVAETEQGGKLIYTRKQFYEWYDSMHEIHLAMLSVCGLLFFIATLNLFFTMIFQYMERKRGLSVLWTLGLREKEILYILVLENIRSILVAGVCGILLSCILCYSIYRIFRTVWQIRFMLPYGQIFLITTAVLAVTAVCVLTEFFLLKKENFLQNIRNFI